MYKRLSQMRAPISALREPAGIRNKPENVLYGFEYKT